MYFSYVAFEYVATSFSPARMDLAVELLSNPPLSSFKKLIVSTPRLVQGLRTMSLAKAVPEDIKDRECKSFCPTRTSSGTLLARKGSHPRNGFPSQE
jgi:hypothetical protein